LTLERRTVLEWLGAALVLPLSAELFAACSDDAGQVSTDSAPHRPDQGHAVDGGASADGASAADDWSVSDAGFPFQPGPGTGHKVFANWPIRTVDPQELTRILASWKLTVDGMVESPHVYSFAELGALPRQDQVTDFHCVEGWSVFDVPWNGVHLSKIFDEVKVKAEAKYVTFHTIGGKYNESLPLVVALEPRTLLAYGIAGSTIPLQNGFPLRLVVPRLLAYKSAKYVDRLELTDKPVEGFWVAAGYDYNAEVPKERLRPGKY
jgi:DMSO/TMAO reductase YedYZ molybdopterin-dependent catalytic subunit